MGKIPDLRVVKTKRAITEALIHLLSEKQFDAITVQDLLAQALINRSTFYRYYSSKFDLADRLCKEQLTHMRSFYPICGASGLDTQPLFDYTYEHRAVLRALCSIRTAGFDFYQDWQKLLEDVYLVGKQPDWDESALLQTRLFVHCTMGSLLYILECDRPIQSSAGRNAFNRFCAQQLGISERRLNQLICEEHGTALRRCGTSVFESGVCR